MRISAGVLLKCRHEATLDTFLADFDDLSDNEAQLDDEIAEAGDMEVDVDGDLADIESINYDDLDIVSKLQMTQRYADIMQKVEDALYTGSDNSVDGSGLEDNLEYRLIVDCNALLVDIENELIVIHNFILHNYWLKFPELASLVHHPIDYSRVVKQIGNAMDLNLVDLEGLLSSAVIMVIYVTTSTTSDIAKKKVLDFVESRMGYIAPNLSAIVGSAVSAKLMGAAGGLSSLTKMPACNVMLLGSKKKSLAGFSTATSQSRIGKFEQTNIFQSTLPSLRIRTCRLLAGKLFLAARVD